MKKVFLFPALAAVLMLAAFTSCDKHTYKTLESVTLSPKSVTIAVGETVQLEAIEKWSEEGDKISYGWTTWESSNETVATITGHDYLGVGPGRVTGVAVGTTTITYKVERDGKSDTCEVTVVAAAE